MTISTTANVISYAGDGSTVSFSVSFDFIQNADIDVQLITDSTGVSTAWTEDTQYTLTGAGVDGGGTLTVKTTPTDYTPASGETLVIMRKIVRTQATDIPTGGELPATSIEDALDKNMMGIQEVFELAETRGYRIPEGESTTVVVPNSVDRASKFMGWDSNGNVIAAAGTSANLKVVSAFIDTLLDDADAATARTTLGAVGLPTIDAKGDILVGTANDTIARKAVGTDGYPLMAESGTADGLFYTAPASWFSLLNGHLTYSVSTNVLTVTVTATGGGNPSATNPVYVIFRDAAAATGDLNIIKLTAATTISIDNGATLGTANSVAFRIWVIGFNDGGTFRLGVINAVTTVASAGSGRDVTAIYPLGGWGIASATQRSAAADSAGVFYTEGAAVTDKAYVVLGYATWESGLGTAGAWSAGPSRAQMYDPSVPLPGQVIGIARVDDGDTATGTTAVNIDDSIPQVTEGTQFLSTSHTPRSAANALRVTAQAVMSHTVANQTMVVAMFTGGVNNSVRVVVNETTDAAVTDSMKTFPLDLLALAEQTTAKTYTVRGGAGTGSTVRFNGADGARRFGDVANSFIEIQEIMG